MKYYIFILFSIFLTINNIAQWIQTNGPEHVYSLDVNGSAILQGLIIRTGAESNIIEYSMDPFTCGSRLKHICRCL